MKRIILIFIIVLFGFMLFGCNCNTTVINKNQYYQTDYDYFCFDETKTWSQIVVCLNTQNKAERLQNKLTNELLDKE